MDSAILKALGINEKAGKIYLTALSLGTASVQAIANTAGIKRPTAYLHIEELVKEGLLEKIPIGKKEYYRAADPALLHSRAAKNLAIIQKALPEMESLKATNEGRPSVRILEGEKGLNDVYEEMIHANTIRFWSDLSSLELYFLPAIQNISVNIAARQIRTKEIIRDTPEARKSSKRYAAVAGKYYASRIATKGEILNDNAIYDDVVAIFRIHEFNLYVVRIEDPTIAATMKTLFDMAWETAEPFIPSIKKNAAAGD